MGIRDTWYIIRDLAGTCSNEESLVTGFATSSRGVSRAKGPRRAVGHQRLATVDSITTLRAKETRDGR